MKSTATDSAADRAMRAYTASVKAIDPASPLTVIIALLRYDEARLAEEHAQSTTGALAA